MSTSPEPGNEELPKSPFDVFDKKDTYLQVDHGLFLHIYEIDDIY